MWSKFKEYFFNRTSKSHSDLNFAVKKNIGTLSIESFNEINSLKKILGKQKQKIDLVLRINLEKQNLHSSIQMMSTPSQFGMDAHQVLEKKLF